MQTSEDPQWLLINIAGGIASERIHILYIAPYTTRLGGRLIHVANSGFKLSQRLIQKYSPDNGHVQLVFNDTWNEALSTFEVQTCSVIEYS